MNIKTIKQAWDEVEEYCDHTESCRYLPYKSAVSPPCTCGYTKAVTALRQALAQPEQEPVAWMEDSIEFYAKDHPTNSCTIPLYTAPPSKPWVDLTNDEAAECWTTSAIMTWKRIQDKLREKNT
jgi:hypothetical protein